MDDKAVDDVADAADRFETLERVVGRLAQAGQDRQRRIGREQKIIAVGRCLGRRFGADHAAGAATILDHERLAKGLAQLVGPGPTDGIGCAPRSVGQNDPDAPLRPGLRRACLRAGRGGEQYQNERKKLAALHFTPPEVACSLALIEAGLLQRLLLCPLLARWTDRTGDDTSSRLGEREATRLAPARSPKSANPRPSV